MSAVAPANRDVSHPTTNTNLLVVKCRGTSPKTLEAHYSSPSSPSADILTARNGSALRPRDRSQKASVALPLQLVATKARAEVAVSLFRRCKGWFLKSVGRCSGFPRVIAFASSQRDRATRMLLSEAQVRRTRVRMALKRTRGRRYCEEHRNGEWLRLSLHVYSVCWDNLSHFFVFEYFC